MERNFYYSDAWRTLKRLGTCRVRLLDRTIIKTFMRGLSKEKNEECSEDSIFRRKKIMKDILYDAPECAGIDNCVVLVLWLMQVSKLNYAEFNRALSQKKRLVSGADK